MVFVFRVSYGVGRGLGVECGHIANLYLVFFELGGNWLNSLSSSHLTIIMYNVYWFLEESWHIFLT